MPEPILPTGLSQLAPVYDALVCDVWGVIHDGRAAFAEACDALQLYRRQGGAVVLVSNSPRPGGPMRDQLRDLGVPDEAWDAIATSGDATRRLLQARSPGPAWAVGPARDVGLYEGLGLHFAETAQEAAFISCSGLFDDEVEQPSDYRDRFQAAVDLGLEMVCANPDRVVQRGDRLIWCAGALAELYDSMGGEVVMAGKPFGPIYDLAMTEIARLLGRDPDRARILAIGDGVATDLKGAAQQGLDCLFILAGIHAGQLIGEGGRPHADRIQRFLTAEGAAARYAMPRLVW